MKRTAIRKASRKRSIRSASARTGERATAAGGRLLLGDCRQVLAQISSASVDCCITDPPYNYEFVGHKWDEVEISRRKARIVDSTTLVKHLPYGSGLAGGVRNARWYERNRANVLEYAAWCREWGAEVYRVCKPGAPIVVFNSPRTAAHVQCALEDVGFYARDCLVYRRRSGIPKGANISKLLERKGSDDAGAWQGWHSCFRSEWDAVVVLQKPLQNSYAETLVAHGTGLFHVEDENGFQSNILEGYHAKDKESFNVHCTVKPLPLMERLVEIFSPPRPDSIILDPFAGSGTTLLAAKNLNRSYIGIEKEVDYIPIIERRLS